jgi:hypothetical protein
VQTLSGGVSCGSVVCRVFVCSVGHRVCVICMWDGLATGSVMFQLPLFRVGIPPILSLQTPCCVGAESRPAVHTDVGDSIGGADATRG